ncbi:Fc.00g016580.m01.CDS01 [Cosmosporella sp. VM-42]
MVTELLLAQVNTAKSLNERLKLFSTATTSLMISEVMDEFQMTSVEYASSKDHPVQRTDVILTSEEIFSRLEPSGPLESWTPTTSSTITLTTTKMRTWMVPAITGSIYSTPPTPSTTLARHAAASSTDTGAPAAVHVGSKSLPAGAIAAVVVGAVIFVALFGAFGWLFKRRRRQRAEWEDEGPLEPRPIRSFTVLNQPQIAELGPSPNHPTSSVHDHDHSFASSAPSDPRLSAWTGVQSPSPKLAVAEQKTYTRAWQKPRLFHVGHGPAELPAEDIPNHVELAELGGNHVALVSPADKRSGRHSLVSPVTTGAQHGGRPLWGRAI